MEYPYKLQLKFSSGVTVLLASYRTLALAKKAARNQHQRERSTDITITVYNGETGKELFRMEESK